MMDITLVRHGQSIDEYRNLHQRGESNLSQTGIEQAHLLAGKLCKDKYDIILTSTLNRSIQTATIIKSLIDIEVRSSNLFNEMKAPKEIENKRVGSKEIDHIIKDISKNWNNPTYRFSDEETPTEFISRVKTALEYITKLDYDNIIVITHGNFIKTAVALVLFDKNLTTEHLGNIWHTFLIENTSLTSLKFNKDRWLITCLNDIVHLTS